MATKITATSSNLIRELPVQVEGKPLLIELDAEGIYFRVKNGRKKSFISYEDAYDRSESGAQPERLKSKEVNDPGENSTFLEDDHDLDDSPTFSATV